MTVKTAPARRASAPAATQESYEALLTRVRQLFATDVETRFEMAKIFSKMLKYKSADEIAVDTDMSPGGVARIARVAEFWGDVRIAPDGKKIAPWFVYDRVAFDTLMSDEHKQSIKKAAPVKGLKVVRQMIRDARAVSAERVNEVVNGKRAAKITASRPARSGRTGNAAGTGHAPVDGSVFVDRAVANLDETVNNLDKLESLSEEDAAVIRAKVNDVVAQLVRLTEVD